MKSREDLVNRALRKLGALPAGQSAEPEDYQAVNGTVESVLSDLASRDIWQWGDPDQIDEDAFEHLAGLLAQANAMDFGVAEDEQKKQLLESRLRQLSLTFLSGEPQRVEYY